jgi:hypothetical protein
LAKVEVGRARLTNGFFKEARTSKWENLDSRREGIVKVRTITCERQTKRSMGGTPTRK